MHSVSYPLARTDARLLCEQAKRAFLETDGQGRLKSVPALPPDAKIEATFVVIESGSSGADRQPPAELAGIEIIGDIVSAAISEDDWGL